MLTAYERRLLAFYLANAASGLHHGDREAMELADWVAERESSGAAPSNGPRPRHRRLDQDTEVTTSACKLRRLEGILGDEYAAMRAVRYDRAAQRLRRLGRTMGLTRTDLGILELLLRYHTQPIIESMVDNVFLCNIRRANPLNLRTRTLPLLLGVSVNAIHRRLRNDAPLVRSGLVSVDSDGELGILSRLQRLVTAPGDAGVDVHRLLLDAASPCELDWSDFDHLARDRDHVERLAKGALDTGATGVNILLHGPPGTGKTQFCKALAERLGATLYTVGESNEHGGEPMRDDRLREVRVLQRLLARQPRSLLLFDEMEDLLSGPVPGFAFFGPSFASRFREGASKVFMHRLLEQTPTPTLWTMNDAWQVSPAILRRMMFALELRPPTVRVRARIWTRQLERHGIRAVPEEAHRLATEFEATPGVAAGVTAAARLAGGDLETVCRGVRSLSRVLACDKPPQRTPDRFDLGLINADTNPATLAERLAGCADRRFSLCLQGPSGSGKSACVRFLAERLGMEVVQKRTSDLLSKWIGETEQRIAAAFAEARDANAFLVFDEADSLLADRRFAQRTWEVSQINEMLTWMESHPLPFACTTNYGEHLDPATLRRFVFKLAFSYLAHDQVAAAFRGYFALTPPAQLSTLTALTPGDFAVGRRKAEILGRLREPDALAAMLHAECDAKPDRPRTIGFRP